MEYNRLDLKTGIDIMSTSKDKPRPRSLSANALRNLIQIAMARGYLVESEHAESHHPERNISIDDVIFGLKQPNWILARAPDWDNDHNNWEYLVKTVNIEGDALEVKLAALPEFNKIVVVSRW
jgi:hypothetical protein